MSMPRCLECHNYLRFSFMDGLRNEPVYECTTVGVQASGLEGEPRVHTLDHIGRYFKLGPVREAKPVKRGDCWTAEAV